MAVVDSRFIGPYLTSKGWEGQLIAFLLSQLSADGQAVQSMKFNMRGKLTTQTVVVKAEKLWEGTEKDVNLLISMPDADKFSFVGGELSSDLLAQDNVKMSAMKGDNIILPSDWEASKVGDLCFRLLAYPVMKSSNTKLFVCSHIKFTVLAFPMAANDMAELTDAKQSESWPGIKILEGKCEFFPRSQGNIIVLVPVLPLLYTDRPAPNCTIIPRRNALHFALAELLKTAVRPNTYVACNTLKKAEAGAMANLENLEPRTPCIVLPSAPRPPADQGKNVHCEYCVCVLLYKGKVARGQTFYTNLLQLKRCI